MSRRSFRRRTARRTEERACHTLNTVLVKVRRWRDFPSNWAYRVEGISYEKTVAGSRLTVTSKPAASYGLPVASPEKPVGGLRLTVDRIEERLVGFGYRLPSKMLRYR